MASEVAQEIKDPTVSPVTFNPGAKDNSSSSTFTLPRSKESIPPIPPIPEDPSSSSAYTLASDQSLYSHQIDRWLQPVPNPTGNAAVQLSRVPVVQRSTLVTTPSLDASGLWYVLAMILPLFSVNNSMFWRCTPGTVINAADIFLNNLRQFCGHARIQVRRMAEDQLARDFFATLMDLVLVIYAIGFLILSLYQASVFG